MKEIRVKEKDDERHAIWLEIIYEKYTYIQRREARQITNNSGKQLKYNEIEQNQDINVLIKKETLTVPL